MINQNKFPEIKLMFDLFRKCPEALSQFKAVLKSYIVSEGKKLVGNDSMKDEELVKNIIEFRQKMVKLSIFQIFQIFFFR